MSGAKASSGVIPFKGVASPPNTPAEQLHYIYYINYILANPSLFILKFFYQEMEVILSTNFFDVVDAMKKLYVTYRGKYVLSIDGKYYTPHSGTEFKKLDGNAIIGHLNRKYAIGVFSAQYGSKFLCFDIDLSDHNVVHKVIDGLKEFGFPENRIYVSSSGGKGYHVEIFFTDLVYLNLLKSLYLWMIQQKGLDPKKVEFRPTFTQAIKLPLSKHHKTGNICWYLDRKTLAPIEDQGYITSIIQMDRDWVEKLIRGRLEVEGFYNEPKRAKPTAKPIDGSCVEYPEYPMMTGPGMRHNMMKCIAVRERYKGTEQEEIAEKLKVWLTEQNPDFITDTWGDAVDDAERLACDVWKPKFVVREREVTIAPEDMETILSCHAPTQKRILFLMCMYTRRYGRAQMTYARIARYAGCSTQAAVNALDALESKGLVAKRASDTVYTNGKFVAGANIYKYCPPLLNGVDDNIIPVHWDFKEETFTNAYVDTMRRFVPQEDWSKYFTKKEMEELKQNGQV